MFEKIAVPKMTLEQERKAWEDTVAHLPLPLSISVQPVEIEGIYGEWLACQDNPNGGTILFLHGGGYTAGSCLTHRELAARLTFSTGFNVLTIDYRLAPEFPFPCALEDAVKTYQWLCQHVPHNKIVLGGDSAGGGLVAATLVKLRDDQVALPACAFLLSPMLDLSFSGTSLETHKHSDPVVTLAGLQKAASYYLGNQDPRHPLVSPLFADLQGLPPMLIQVGGHEVLLSDSLRFAERAAAAKVDVRLEVWAKMNHVWHASAELPEAKTAIAHITAFITTLQKQRTS